MSIGFTSISGCDSLVHLTLIADKVDANIIVENNGPL